VRYEGKYEKDKIIENLMRNFDPTYQPVENIVEHQLLHSKSFNSTAQVLQTSQITAAGYLIIAGTHANQGQVITRAFNRTD